jgi:hypothetical protein
MLSHQATSHAPQIGRKRRFSASEREESLGPAKRARGTSSPDEAGSREQTPPATPAKETEEVKQVTRGVKEVELEDKVDKPEEAESGDEKQDSVSSPSKEEAVKGDNTKAEQEQANQDTASLKPQAVDSTVSGSEDINAEDVPLPEGEDEELRESSAPVTQVDGAPVTPKATKSSASRKPTPAKPIASPLKPDGLIGKGAPAAITRTSV